MFINKLLSDRQAYVASFVIIMGSLLLLLPLRLLPCFMAGFLVYETINTLTPHFEKFIRGERARWLVVSLVSIVVIGVLIGGIATIASYVMQELKNFAAINLRISIILHDAQMQITRFAPDYLPVSVEEIKNETLGWLQRHLVALQNVGKNALHAVATVLIGMVLGAIISLHNLDRNANGPVLKRELLQRLSLLSRAFRNVVFAQIKISAINTLFSAIFILGVLPMLGIHIPLAKTLVVLTFLFGLLPVIGNLISNTLVFASALSISMGVALGALLYLVIIHKFEYFLNARIVGGRINSSSWEILIAMLVFEAAFGLAGVVAAPVYYAYLKSELKQAGLV